MFLSQQSTFSWILTLNHWTCSLNNHPLQHLCTFSHLPLELSFLTLLGSRNELFFLCAIVHLLVHWHRFSGQLDTLEFSIQKLKMKLGFPDNRQLKTKDIQTVKKTNKQKFNIHKKFIPDTPQLTRTYGSLKEKDQKQLNLSKMKVFLKPNRLVQVSCKSDCKQECCWRLKI